MSKKNSERGENGKYYGLNLYFNRSNDVEMDAYRFLTSSPRYKTRFVVALISRFLRDNGIKNVDKLTSAQMRETLENYETLLAQKPEEDNVTQPAILSTPSPDMITALQLLLSCQGAIQQNMAPIQSTASISLPNSSQNAQNSNANTTNEMKKKNPFQKAKDFDIEQEQFVKKEEGSSLPLKPSLEEEDTEKLMDDWEDALKNFIK